VKKAARFGGHVVGNLGDSEKEDLEEAGGSNRHDDHDDDGYYDSSHGGFDEDKDGFHAESEAPSGDEGRPFSNQSKHITMLKEHSEILMRMYDCDRDENEANCATFALPVFNTKQKKINWHRWVQTGYCMLPNGSIVCYCNCSDQGISV
jgi:hypothetical protein